MSETIEKWMRDVPECTLTEKWADKLVYNIDGPQNLEVHSPCTIELDGKPMLIPACVVMAGNTNFEFFDNKEELFRYVCAKTNESKKKATNVIEIQDLNAIDAWVKTWLKQYKAEHEGFSWSEVTRSQRPISDRRYYDVTKADKPTRRLEIREASRGTFNATVSFVDRPTIKTFSNGKELGKRLLELITSI